MHQVRLAAPDDFDGWRNAARALVRADVVPDAVTWVVPGESEDLFAETVLPPAAAPDASFTVPRRFRDLAADVVCHRDPERFALLYRLLWRLRAVPQMLDFAADPTSPPPRRWRRRCARTCTRCTPSSGSGA